MKNSEELCMTYSGLLSQKDGKKIVRVSFTRGEDFAEGIVPSGTIEKFSGFDADELSQLSEYLARNADEILAKAKEVNPLRDWIKPKR